MATVEERYPEIREYLDHTDAYENSATEVKQGGDRFLIVTQRGEIDGQQILFKWNGEHFEFWDKDTVIDIETAIPTVGGLLRRHAEFEALVQCGPSSAADHRQVYDYVVSQVNRFDSSTGPDHGNLACVWTVRNLVFAALQRWITKTDSTSRFDSELRSCFNKSFESDDVVPGGIIISPTGRNTGHVGFLGTGDGGARRIYSNSSTRARLEQNYTVATWFERYHKRKHLSVHFYPLSQKSVPLTS
jgi:hypothetical protein